MRILTRISGWPTEEYRSKLALLSNMFETMERKGFVSDYYFVKVVVSFYPRSVIAQDYVPPEVETVRLETNDLERVYEYTMRAVRRIFNRTSVFSRGSQVKIYTTMRFLDMPVAGSLILRLQGTDKKEYGDIDFYLYNNKYNGEKPLSDLLLEVLSDNKSLAREIDLLYREFFKNEHIKIISIMDPRFSINLDYDRMISIAYNMDLGKAILSHISLIRRYIKAKRSKKNEKEIRIIRKLGAIYNLSKVVQDFTRNRRRTWIVFRALRKKYDEANTLATAGSLVLVSRGGYFEDAYPVIVDLVDDILAAFPDEDKYSEWIREGLQRIANY